MSSPSSHKKLKSPLIVGYADFGNGAVKSLFKQRLLATHMLAVFMRVMCELFC